MKLSEERTEETNVSRHETDDDSIMTWVLINDGLNC